MIMVADLYPPSFRKNDTPEEVPVDGCCNGAAPLVPK